MDRDNQWLHACMPSDELKGRYFLNVKETNSASTALFLPPSHVMCFHQTAPCRLDGLDM